MIFEKGGRAWRETVRSGVTSDCSNCNNSSEVEVWGSPAGPYLGYALLPKKAIVGKKEYFLICGICGWIQAQLSKAQVRVLKQGI